jgi:hypothetical protein
MAVQWLNQALCFYQSLCMVEIEVLSNPSLYFYLTITGKCKTRHQRDNLLIKDRKNDMIEQTRHKSTHLQTVQANARPKFAKELFLADAQSKFEIFVI